MFPKDGFFKLREFWSDISSSVCVCDSLIQVYFPHTPSTATNTKTPNRPCFLNVFDVSDCQRPSEEINNSQSVFQGFWLLVSCFWCLSKVDRRSSAADKYGSVLLRSGYKYVIVETQRQLTAAPLSQSSQNWIPTVQSDIVKSLLWSKTCKNSSFSVTNDKKEAPHHHAETVHRSDQTSQLRAQNVCISTFFIPTVSSSTLQHLIIIRLKENQSVNHFCHFSSKIISFLLCHFWL